MRLHRPQRGRIHHGPSQRSAFVMTRSGFQPMPTGGHGDDVGLAAVTGAAVDTVRRFMPIEPPRALQAALAPLDDDQYVSKLGSRCVGTLKLPEDHILSVPGLLDTFFNGLLIRRALPLSASSGSFSFILLYSGEHFLLYVFVI